MSSDYEPLDALSALEETTKVKRVRRKGRSHEVAVLGSSGAATPHRSLIRWDAGPGVPDADFLAFADLVRGELDPHGALEAYLVELMIRRAGQLRDLTAQPAPALDTELAVQRGLVEALRAFDRCRSRRSSSWGQGARPVLGREVQDDPTPDDQVARGRTVDPDAVDTVPAASETVSSAPAWQERLVLDPKVSEVSPVIRGTWITVRHIITLIVDGWSWEEILRTHPEVTEPDIRACLTYTIDDENGPRY